MKEKTKKDSFTSRSIRTYKLASPVGRGMIDLRNYEAFISDSVHDVIPDAVVTVEKDSYTVNSITKGEAISIGKILSPVFKQEALYRATIFVGSPCDAFTEDNDDEADDE